MTKKSEIELHIHPFLGNNTLMDIVSAMDKRNLDIIALESLDASLYPFVIGEVKKLIPSAIYYQSGIRLPNRKYLLNAREYNTKENLHILTVGHSMDEALPKTEIRRIIDNGLQNDALILLDHPFIDNGKTKTAGHIPDKLEQGLESLCKEYSGQVALEWNAYCIPWIRNVLKHGLNLAGLNVKYHDVNKRAEELSERLRQEGYNCPIVASTDLHARNKRHLQTMGTSRIITEIEGETARDVVKSIRKNIFSGDYGNVKKYTGSLHLFEAFCIPILLPRYFKMPRA